MKSIIKELENLYLSKLSRIKDNIDIYNKTNNRNLEGPFLMSSREDLYHKAKYKILFIGQESYRLKDKYNPESEFPSLMESNIYVIEKNHNNSPFWRTMISINESLNKELALNSELNDNCCFFWTNVSKYSNAGGPITPEEHRFIVEQTKHILSDEIKIIEPNVVIFLSGPLYDDKIRIQFDEQLKFETISEDIPLREFARLKHPILPKNTFRTYHPGARVKNKKFYIQQILGHCMDYDIIKPLNDFTIQIEAIAKELKLEFTHPDKEFGQKETGFYFLKSEWKYFRIGFVFEKELSDFFAGICKKENSVSVPEDSINSIQSKLVMITGKPTKDWPYWFWFDSPYRKWDIDTFKVIGNGNLIRTIKNKTEEILIILKDLEKEGVEL